MPADIKEKVLITCAATGRTLEVSPLQDGTPALPRNWKRLGEAVYSPEGLEQRFFLRAIQLPIASVSLGYGAPNGSPEACKAAWQQLRAALREAWQQGTQMGNWFLGELAKSDNEPLVRGPKGPALPKWTMTKELAQQLYAGARLQWPDYDSQGLGGIRQQAYALYKGCRFERRILGTISLPSFRSPTPLPIQAKDWRLDWEGECPLLRTRINGGQYTLRLQTGHRYARQVAGLRHALELGSGRELEITEKRVDTDHGNTGTNRTQPGANRWQTRAVATFSVYLPKTPGNREKVVQVRTAADKLWTVWIDGREQLWNVNADHLRRLIMSHRLRLHRLSEDEKLERRRPRRERAQINGHRETFCREQHECLDDALDKLSRSLVRFAVRGRAARLDYDDADQGYLPSFPWFKLRTLVEQKAREFGIAFEHKTPSGPTESE